MKRTRKSIWYIAAKQDKRIQFEAPVSNKSIFQKLDITLANTVFTLLFFAGLMLTIMEILLYEDTFINPAIPTLIWLFPGLLAMPLLPKVLELQIKTASMFLQAVYNFATWGGFFVYPFMALNFYFAKGDNLTKKFVIQSTSHFAKGTHGCGNPIATVIYKGVEKDLIFPCDVPIEKYKAVDLKIDNGLFGYEVIKDKKLYEK